MTEIHSTSEANLYPETALPAGRLQSPAEKLALRASIVASEPLGLQDRQVSIVPTGPLGPTTTNVSQAKPTRRFFSRLTQSVGTVTQFFKKGAATKKSIDAPIEETSRKPVALKPDGTEKPSDTETLPSINLPIEGQEPRFVVLKPDGTEEPFDTETLPPINLPIEAQEPRFVFVNPDGTVPEKPIDAETGERINLPIEEGRGPRFVLLNPDDTVPEKPIDAETGERINLHEEKEKRREDRITLLLQAKANRESKREAFVPEKPTTPTRDYDFDIVEVEPKEERSASAARPDTPTSSAKAHEKRREMEIEERLKSTADTSTKHVKKKSSEGAEHIQTNPEKKQKSETRTFTWLRRQEKARGD